MLKYFIAIMLCCGLALGQDTPVVPEPVKPAVTPTTVTENVSIIVPKGVLGDGKRLSPYEFDSTTKCYISLPLVDESSLKTLVWYTDDGPPDIEPINATKEYPGTILSFSQQNEGLYLVEADWDKGFSKIWFRIKGSGPPPPVVDPNIPPGPGPIPPGPVVDPTVQPGFRVLTIYESTAKLTSAQSNIMTAVRIRKYLDAKCSKGTEGQYNGLAEYRFWDKDGKDVPKDTTTIKNMWAKLKEINPATGQSTLSSTPLPFMAIEGNGKKIVVPLRETATVESVMTKLIEIGGPE